MSLKRVAHLHTDPSPPSGLAPPPSVVAVVPVAVGERVGAEWRGRGVGVCEGAASVGARHPPPLPQISVLLEASQAGRPASQQGEVTAHTLLDSPGGGFHLIYSVSCLVVD